MFWLGFLFGDEHRQLKEIERSRKQRELEEREKKAALMLEDFEPFLTTMGKEGMTETSVVFSDCSRFSYNALPKVLSKLGSKSLIHDLKKKRVHLPSHSIKIVQKRFLSFIWLFC